MRKSFKNQSQFFPLPVAVIGTYDENGQANAMTAAWATIYDYGQLIICIDESHKTAKNIVKSKAFTVSFATKQTVKIADYIGLVSGNDQPNKVENAKLTVIKSENVNAPLFDEFPFTIECKLISYENGYAIGQMVCSSIDEKYLDNNNKLKSIDFVIYDSIHNTYRVVGEKVLNAFTTKKI